MKRMKIFDQIGHKKKKNREKIYITQYNAVGSHFKT